MKLYTASLLLFVGLVLPTGAETIPDGEAMRGRWLDLWTRLSARGAAGDEERVYNQLVAGYGEPHRAYHTLAHIRHALEELESAAELAEDREAVEFALWFHDVVYEIGGADNEGASADLAVDAALGLGMRAGWADRVSELILATRHGTGAAHGDAQLVVDIDLAILGQPSARFDAYEVEIRIEYAAMLAERGVEAFNRGRAAILKRLLERPAIYSTALFHARYEAAARDNLRRSIEKLESGAWTEP